MSGQGTTLVRGSRIHTPAHHAATAMVLRGDRVAWVGTDDAPETDGAHDTVVDLGSALVTPAFVDAHVHATMTGHRIESLDLSGARSVAEALDLVERHTRAVRGRVVLGMAWDESGWPEQRPPTASELDRAGYGGAVYLTRVDGHSAAVSSALLAAVPQARGAAGWSDSGWLRQAAHHHVRHAVAALVPEAQRRAAQRSALRRAAEVGIGCIHECGGPDIGGADDLRALLALAAAGAAGPPVPDVVAYWGETAAHGGLARAAALGADGAAGDLFVDGALGSRTAALRAPYDDARGPDAGDGALYLDAEQVAEHLVACTRAGVQGGFHVIGDRAHDAVADGLTLATAQLDEAGLGEAPLRAARHRLEHVEMPDERAVAALARAGVVASMQPVFDALWGGAGGLYEARLGTRAPGMNPFGALAAAGVPLAFGSDSPVTPLGPWAAVRAAVHHHDEPCRLTPAAAFAAHTVGGWYAAKREAGGAGTLVPGAPATYAAWRAGELDADGLPDLSPGSPAPTCLRTVVRGRTVFDVEEALR